MLKDLCKEGTQKVGTGHAYVVWQVLKIGLNVARTWKRKLQYWNIIVNFSQKPIVFFTNLDNYFKLTSTQLRQMMPSVAWFMKKFCLTWDVTCMAPSSIAVQRITLWYLQLPESSRKISIGKYNRQDIQTELLSCGARPLLGRQINIAFLFC